MVTGKRCLMFDGYTFFYRYSLQGKGEKWCCTRFPKCKAYLLVNGMPPKSNAERQKKYREKLKRENPNKYEEMRIRHLDKVKENIKKKKESLTDEQKEKLRVKWRKAYAKRAKIKKETRTKIPKD